MKEKNYNDLRSWLTHGVNFPKQIMFKGNSLEVREYFRNHGCLMMDVKPGWETCYGCINDVIDPGYKFEELPWVWVCPCIMSYGESLTGIRWDFYALTDEDMKFHLYDLFHNSPNLSTIKVFNNIKDAINYYNEIISKSDDEIEEIWNNTFPIESKSKITKITKNDIEYIKELIRLCDEHLTIIKNNKKYKEEYNAYCDKLINHLDEIKNHRSYKEFEFLWEDVINKHLNIINKN